MSRPDGKIITFYSYKGGAGRSMALANVAWILASQGKRVLMIDWDLEAPGLHRYFHPFLVDPDLTSTEGIIDFVWDFAMDMVTPPETELGRDGGTWLERAADLTAYTVGLNFDFGSGRLDFVPAGRQDLEYAARVNAFSWENFYTRLRGGILLEAMRKQLKSNYDFVLLDSRTGVSDTSGICTVQMPDQLVVCVTCNNQSIRGAAAVVGSIMEQREKAGRGGDGERLQVFPLLMRIDLAEKDKLDASRAFARQAFSGYPNHLDTGRRERYWRKSEVLYQSYYAYEEILATFGDSADSDKTLLSDFETLVGQLTGGEIEELGGMFESTRLDYKAKFLRSPVETVNVAGLKDLESIALYRQVKSAAEEWERSGRRPAKLLRWQVSKELSYARDVRSALLGGEGFSQFIDQSFAIRSFDRIMGTASVITAFYLALVAAVLVGMLLGFIFGPRIEGTASVIASGPLILVVWARREVIRKLVLGSRGYDVLWRAWEGLQFGKPHEQ
jgi:cellulose biosynthesis protein BcsQ